MFVKSCCAFSCYFSILWTLTVEIALCETAFWWLWLRLSAVNTNEVSKSAAGLYWRMYFLSSRMWLLGLPGFLFQESLFCSSFHLQCFSSRSSGCLNELHPHFLLPLPLQLFLLQVLLFCSEYQSILVLFSASFQKAPLCAVAQACYCLGKSLHRTLPNCKTGKPMGWRVIADVLYIDTAAFLLVVLLQVWQRQFLLSRATSSSPLPDK